MGSVAYFITQLAIYKWYILPIGWLDIIYHRLREPETAIENNQRSFTKRTPENTYLCIYKYIYIYILKKYILYYIYLYHVPLPTSNGEHCCLRKKREESWWNHIFKINMKPHHTLPKLQVMVPWGSMYDIFTYIWLTFMGNVGKYTIHGSSGVNCLFRLVVFHSWDFFYERDCYLGASLESQTTNHPQKNSLPL